MLSDSDSDSNTGTETTRVLTQDETKLGVGRKSLVQTNYEFAAADAVPFDVYALYNYLTVQAEDQPCGTPTEIIALFETEFASEGAVPKRVRTTIGDRLTESNMTEWPPGDDLKRNALVTFFVDEYSYAFAAQPETLPDPRGVPLHWHSHQDSLIERLFHRLTSLLIKD